MNEKDFTLLNDYFDGLLPPESERQVKERVASDPEFQAAFKLHQDMLAFPRRNEQRQVFTGTLERIGQDFFKADGAAPATFRTTFNWGKLTAAAAAIALLLAAVWFMNRSSEPEYRQFAQHAPLSLTVRGASDQLKSQAEQAFNRKDFAAAQTALSKVLEAEPDNLTARLFQGICLIETDQFSQARTVLSPIADGASALKGDAQWYVALSYLKEKNMDAWQEALKKIQPGTDQYDDAQKWLDK